MTSMTVQPETIEPSAETRAARAAGVGRAMRTLGASVAFLMRAALWVGVLMHALLVLGGGTPSSRTLFQAQMRSAATGWDFDLLGWEVDALARKAGAFVSSPLADMDDLAQSSAVRAYLERARTIALLEDQIVALSTQTAETFAGDGVDVMENRGAMVSEVQRLRARQDKQRPIAEAVIEQQITTILREQGFGFLGKVTPPVTFSFTESPKKLIVSPRSRIITRDSMILNPDISVDEAAAAESALEASGGDISVYITPTGGMGAFPTMVVEDASLPWILSTVAHEWVHTYLALYPLGFNYGIDQENTTINETAADLVGDEVGMLALQRYYPDLVPAPVIDEEPSAPAPAPPVFDFRKEMAETRQTVDKFLRYGRVADAEHYMEIRRLLFVENGYNLRKLNQAYFAFHGSYGTSAAADVSTPDALGPRVGLLRVLTGDAVTFLRTIRGITDRAGLERLIGEYSI